MLSGKLEGPVGLYRDGSFAALWRAVHHVSSSRPDHVVQEPVEASGTDYKGQIT